MAKRGGFSGGMPGNMNNLMKQAQRMQHQMEEASKEMEGREVTATAGGGVIEVTATGKKEIKKITISPDAVDPEDVETLEDPVMTEVKEAPRTPDELAQEDMDKFSGGLGGGMLGV